MNKSKSFLGTSAMATSSALRVAIQIAILPIIGRILGPQSYGQIALVSPFVFFAMMLAESGLGACIVRADEVTKDLEGTVLSFSSGLSLFIVLLFALLAYPLGLLLHEPRFPALLIGMSSILLLASLLIVPSALLLRAKRYDYIALADTASSIGGLIGVGVGIGLDWGVWSLVAQQVALWTAKLAVTIIAARWRPVFKFSREVLNKNILFSMNLTGSSIVSFISRNIDNVLIGAFLGTQALGYYALAFQIVSLPQMVFSGSLYFTVFSKVSEAHRQSQSSQEPFLQALKSALLIGLPTMTGIVATAQTSIPLILGNKWDAVSPLVMMLMPFGIGQTLWAVLYGVFIGQGRSDDLLKINILASAATIIAIIGGLSFGIMGVAIGVSLSALFGVFIALRSITKSYSIGAEKLKQVFVAPLIASLVMGASVFELQRLLTGQLNPLVSLTLLVAVGVILYVFVLLAFFHEHIVEDVAMMKAALFSQTRSKEI